MLFLIFDGISRKWPIKGIGNSVSHPEAMKTEGANMPPCNVFEILQN